MGKGKLVAQGAHASQQAIEIAMKKDFQSYQNWLDSGCKKIVLKVSSLSELIEIQKTCRISGIPGALIVDAGHTQVESNTPTAFGVGPYSSASIDKVVGNLKLL